jgi:hypothetical protein
VEINHALAAGFGVAELQSAHAANAAHEGVLHHLAKGGGNRSIEGIAGQDFQLEMGDDGNEPLLLT